MTYVPGTGVIVNTKKEEEDDEEEVGEADAMGEKKEEEEEESSPCWLTAGTSCKKKVLQINQKGKSSKRRRLSVAVFRHTSLLKIADLATLFKTLYVLRRLSFPSLLPPPPTQICSTR